MVALPAIGALFVAHLAHQDYERMEEEHQRGHTAAFVSFLAAFAFDVVRGPTSVWGSWQAGMWRCVARRASVVAALCTRPTFSMWLWLTASSSPSSPPTCISCIASIT